MILCLYFGMSTIKSSCDLLQFVAGRRVSIGTFVNKKTNDPFKSIILTDEKGNHSFIAFSSNLGELSSGEIVKMKNDLQVVTMDSGTHILCKKGANTWEDVQL
jgi:hypothetical protein